MRGTWQQGWLAVPATMVGNHFVVLAILPGLHTLFHWPALAKARKQLWIDFVATILCAEHVADAFGSRSPLTTMKVMLTPLSKLLQEQVRDPASVWRSGLVDVISHWAHLELWPWC